MCAIEKEPRSLHEAQAAIPRSSAQTEEDFQGLSGSVGLVVCLLWLIYQSVRELGVRAESARGNLWES